MKQNLRFLLTLVVMLLASATTWAAATDWTVVKIAAPLSELATNGDTVYIQNVGTGRYIGAAEAWGSQACLVPESSRFKCILVKEGETYKIKDDRARGEWETGSGENIIYRHDSDGQLGQGVKGCFTDYSTAFNAERSKWTVALVEGKTNVYTFQDPNGTSTEYWGVNRKHASNNKVNGITWGLYYDCVLGDSAENCQFVFLPVKLYEAKTDLVSKIKWAASCQLPVETAKPLIGDENATLEQVQAKAAMLVAKVRLYNLKGSQPEGTDVSSAEAVLNNEEATAEEVEAEIEKLIGATRKAGTTTRPTDVTKAYLPNTTPTAANSVPTGWTVTNANGGAATTGSSNGTSVCEFWGNAAYTLKTTVHLKAGVYRFSCEAQTRSGMHSKFFVNDNAIDIVTTGHNSSGAVQDFFNHGNGRNYISVKLPADADVTIGLTSDNTTGDHWTVWRNFYIESLGEDLPATALSIPAKDDNAHYATFSSAAPTVFAAEGTAVYGVSVDNGAIQLNELTKATYKLADREKNEVEGYYVPANTGVLVKTASADAAEAQHHFPMEVLSVELPANQLKSANADGSVFTAQDGYRYYKLAYNNFTEKTGLGFYWGADNGVAFKLKAGLAYLAVPATEAGAKGFRFDGVTDGIDGVSVDGSKAQVIYNVNGQRVANMSKAGLYIVNGKKVVVK